MEGAEKMTEEERLNRAPGCGHLIMLGLIGIVILSLVGIIFPVDVLPYSNSILIGVLVIAMIALAISILMWRRKVKDKIQEENDKADNMLRHQLDTLGDKDDEAMKLAEKYKQESE